MCLFPRLIPNKKYKPNKKNGGQVPPMKDPRVGLVAVGCGVCMECMKKKANEWRIRLAEEVRENTNGKFITLTFSNEKYTEYAKRFTEEGYELDNKIAKAAVREFLERWRKKHKKSVRHWLITELGHGSTEHLHLHGIIWADDVNEIEKKWQNGWVWKGKMHRGRLINYVSERTANYIVKYVTKIDQQHKEYKPIILCSPGIGSGYMKTKNSQLNKFNEYETKETYTTRQGMKVALPIYYRNKLYSEDEREELWLRKLDEGIRYVGGEKVKEEDIEEYNKLLKHYKKINLEIGYKEPGRVNNKEYEENRRKLKQMKRGVDFSKYKGMEPGIDDW